MAWHALPDGSKHCDVCNVEFRAPRSCACPHVSPSMQADSRLGPMETLTAQAAAEGLLDRLGVERLLMARIRSADKVAKHYRTRSALVLERGAVRMGREGPIDADEDKTAQGWDALAEQARNRGDKSAGRLTAMIYDRERRADLERQERLAEQALGKKPARGAN